jgi:hypothetical protein
MRFLLLLFFLSVSVDKVFAEELSDNDDDTEELTLDTPDYVLPDEMCYPYDVDVDEVWFWENETMYPTRKEDSWVEDLSRPW